MAPASKARPKRIAAGPFSSDRILNSSSPVVHKDLHAFLIACISGWSSYSPDEKRSIIGSLPPAYRVYNTNAAGDLLCPITVDFVQQDPWVKAAVGKFKRDVEDGYYERGWQTKAKRAMAERRGGKFDEYLKEHAEELFGQGRGTGDGDGDGDEQQSGSDWERQNPGKKGKKAGGRPAKDFSQSTEAKTEVVSKVEAVVTTRSGRRSAKPALNGR